MLNTAFCDIFAFMAPSDESFPTDSGEEKHDVPILELYCTQQDIIIISALLPDEEIALRRRLQANSRAFNQHVQDGTRQRAFLNDVEAMDESEEEEGDDSQSLVKIARSIDGIYKKFLGEKWVSEANTEIAKVVKYRRNGEVVAMEVVSPHNFFFNPPEARFFNDTFPPSGQILASDPQAGRVGKNVSIFDPNGVKVFWGDLKDEDITGLQGTYYVLDERSSYHAVPDHAIVIDAQQTSADPSRPEDALVEYMPSDKPMLEVDYVKTHAVYAIVGGTLVPNNKATPE